MLIGYARTSTVDQDYGLDAQIEALTAAGCDPEFIYREKVSSVANRPKLDEVLKHLRKGDTLVVTKLDRLARSIVSWPQRTKWPASLLGQIRCSGTPRRV